jgi:hypothetical protein
MVQGSSPPFVAAPCHHSAGPESYQLQHQFNIAPVTHPHHPHPPSFELDQSMVYAPAAAPDNPEVSQARWQHGMMAAAVFMPVVCPYVPMVTYPLTPFDSDRFSYLFQTSTVNQAPADGGGGGVDTDAVEQGEESEIEIGTGDRDITDAVIDAAVGSEVEEYSLLRDMQEVKRKHPKQHKFRNHRPRQWQVPIGECSVEVKDIMPHGKPLGIEEYRKTYDKNRNIVAEYAHIALSARFTLERWIKDGDRELGILLDSLPDTDGEGQHILEEDFEIRWGSDTTLLLKHLFTKHWGELIELEMVWNYLDGDMPAFIYTNPQFASTTWDAAQIRRSKGLGKGTASAVGDRVPAIGGRAPAVGGREPAVGVRAPAVGGKTRVCYREGDRVKVKQATVITLPDLFLTMRKQYTATVLYRFWCKSYSVVLRRPHAWTNPARQVAALNRFQESGFYGFSS